ncbi:MAG: hypothetical protein M3063_06150 [Actinomycetota bacterium]|nr:hypothetical protein [Actinomycetota bacterium]
MDVTVALDDLSIRAKALIDTGSPRTIFPRGVGDLLSVDFPQYSFEGTKNIRLLGHDWPAISETVTLSLEPFGADLAWEAEVDFVLEDRLEFAILGYDVASPGSYDPKQQDAGIDCERLSRACVMAHSWHIHCNPTEATVLVSAESPRLAAAACHWSTGA